MSIEVKISKIRIPYKKAINILEKRVEDVKKGSKIQPNYTKLCPKAFKITTSF